MITKNIMNFLADHYALVIGLILVITISMTTYFYDFYTLTLMAQRVASGHFGVYRPFQLIQSSHFYLAPTTVVFNGPPLSYLVDGSLYAIFKYLHIATADVANNIPNMLQLLGLKLRYILVFVLSYPLILKTASTYIKDKKLIKRIANLWVLSPLLVYLPFAQGNNDIYPAVASLLFLLFAFRRQYFWAMVSLGVMASFKNYALFLALPAAIILADKRFWRTIFYSLIPPFVYFIFCLPYINHLNNFLGGGGEGLFVLKAVIPSMIPYAVFPIAYFAGMFTLIFGDNQKQLIEKKNESLCYYMLFFSALPTISSYFYPQWVLWTLPFLVFVIYRSRKLVWLYILMFLALFGLTITYFANYIDISMYKPLLHSTHKYIHLSATGNGPMLMIALFVAAFGSLLYLANKERDSAMTSFKKEYHYVLLSLLPMVIILLYVISDLLISTHRG